MYLLRKLFVLFFLILSLVTYSQQIALSGSVRDKETGKALPFSNVFIRNTYWGTTSNKEGRFKILIPEVYKNKKICFSHIGYKTKEIDILNSPNELSIKLEKETFPLTEVVIYPDSTLYYMLKNAYNSIEKNYLQEPSLQKVFYRDIIKSTEGSYWHFGEALLEVYKTSYKNSSDGQIRLVKSRLNKFPTDSNNIYFYGGMSMPNWIDKVKFRANFISPRHFKQYTYTLEGQTYIDGTPAHIISFSPKNKKENAFYQGKFYLDTTSLAYLHFDLKLSEYGIKKRNLELFPRGKCLSRNFIIHYQQNNGYYFLKYAFDRELLYNSWKKTKFHLDNELVTFEIILNDVKPIPYDKQIQTGDFFLFEAQDYQESFWKDNNILLQDSSLSSAYKMQYSPEESKNIQDSLKTIIQSNRKKGKELLIKIASKTYFDIDFSIPGGASFPVNTELIYRPSVNHLFQKTRTETNDMFLNIGMKTGYKISTRWDINCYEAVNLGNVYTKHTSFGGAYQFCLVNRGKQLLVHLGVNYYFSKSGYHVGNFSNNNGTFYAGGKKINAKKLSLYCGKKEHGFSPEIMIKRKLRGIYYLFLSGTYHIPVSEKNMLFVKERNKLFPKTANVPLNDSSIEYFEDNVPLQTTSFEPGHFFFKAGVRLSF